MVGVSVLSTTTSARQFTAPSSQHVRQQQDGRSVARALAVARLALGERMFAADIDDGETGGKIAALDLAIRRAEADGQDCQDLQRKREWLILRLADAALDDDAPLPGADAQYAQVRALLAALNTGGGDEMATVSPSEQESDRPGGSWQT